jgi:hypothetical protein
VFTVQLHNPHQVAAEWSIKKPAVESPKLRDWGFFVPSPAEGVLEPGARASLTVTFTPQARDGLGLALLYFRCGFGGVKPPSIQAQQ